MKQETKNKLRKALVEVANREADEAIAGTPGPVILSDEFCEKMEDTILDTDAGGKWSRQKTRLVALVIAMLMLIAACGTACAFYEEISAFIINVYEEYIKIEPAENGSTDAFHKNAEIDSLYTFESVPDGYSAYSMVVTDNMASFMWNDSHGNMLLLVERCAGGIGVTDIPDPSCKEMIIEGRTVYYDCKESVHNMAWFEDGYFFKLTWDGYISDTEILESIKSLKKIK